MESRLLEDHLRAENSKLRAEVQAWRDRWKALREQLAQAVLDRLSYGGEVPPELEEEHAKAEAPVWLDEFEQQHPVGTPKILSPAGIGSSEQVAAPGSR